MKGNVGKSKCRMSCTRSTTNGLSKLADGGAQFLRGRLDNVPIHHLRHSYASRVLALGKSLPMSRRLLGHTQVETTAAYALLARAPIKASSARVADSIGADILDVPVANLECHPEYIPTCPELPLRARPAD